MQKKRLAACAVLVLAACRAPVPVPVAQLPPAIALDEASNGLAQTLQRGQQLVLTLPANPSTGYRWHWRLDGNPLLAAVGEPLFVSPSPAGLPGAGGVERWVLQAQTPGRGQLVFEYRRPWESGAPLRELVFPLEVSR